MGIKSDLKDELAPITKIYSMDDSLRIINFIPFMFNDYEELSKGLCWLSDDSNENNEHSSLLSQIKKHVLTSPGKKDFIKRFSIIIDNEFNTFYRDYWKREQERLKETRGQFEEFIKSDAGKVLTPLLKRENKKIVLYLCLSMTRNGRGFGSKNFCSAVRFPEERKEFLPSLITMVREITLQLIAPIIGISSSQSSSPMPGSDGYRNHMAMENGAIYFDYLLFQKHLPEILKEYLLFYLGISGIDGKDKSIEDLSKIFKARYGLSPEAIGNITDNVNKL